MVKQKVLILAGLAGSLQRFRGPLIKSLVARGHEVHAIAPSLTEDTETAEWLCRQGVVCHKIPFSRVGLNPFSDLRLLVSLVIFMRRIQPNVFIGYTIKPVIWGTLAAKIAGVPSRVALITGLGYAFTGSARGKRWFIQKIARWLYGLALQRSTLVFLQNQDDLQDFRSLGLLPENVPAVIVNGSGIDTAAFSFTPLPEGPINFLLIARLLGDKGIREYVAAARHLRQEWPEARWHLVGGFDSNPDGLSKTELAEWVSDGLVTWHGALADVRPAIASCSVYVLPSYREGTPRTVLEALSMGRPVITTDAPGCRETVVDGENGFLVPPKDVPALAAAMKRFLQEPSLGDRMSVSARTMAETKYDVQKVNAVMLDSMEL